MAFLTLMIPRQAYLYTDPGVVGRRSGPPEKSQVILVSIGNKQMDHPLGNDGPTPRPHPG